VGGSAAWYLLGVPAAKRTRSSAAIPDRLWRVPVYLPYLQPALTDRAVERAEAKLGVKLPRAYLEALRIQNGGYLRLSAHPSGRAPVDCIAGIGPRYPALGRRDWSEVKEYMADQGITKPARLDALVPFCGDGHYHYCFDYRQSGPKREPRITYIDVECFDVDDVLAPDFLAFVKQLGPQDRAEVYGLVTRERADRVAAAVSSATGYCFEDQGDQDSGYRIFRARLPGQASWAWLSANQARRGFVRKNDTDYKRLSKLLPELVDRHPEHADCGYFLSSTSFEGKAGKAMVRRLAKLPFAARAVRLDE